MTHLTNRKKAEPLTNSITNAGLVCSLKHFDTSLNLCGLQISNNLIPHLELHQPILVTNC